MNAFKPLLSRTMARRFATAASPKSAIPSLEKYNFQKTWLSDPSTYPLIAILGCAVTFMCGMSVNALTSYKDVQIDRRKRGSMLQTWGQEEHPSLLSRVIYWNSFQKNAPEGLGIDHEQWAADKKRREAM